MKRLVQACLVLSTLFLTGCCCWRHQCGGGCNPCCGPREDVRWRKRAVYLGPPAPACCDAAPPLISH